jgi:predicted secreted Zn-dependent protease
MNLNEALNRLNEAFGPSKTQAKAIKLVKRLSAAGAKKEKRAERAWVQALAERAVWGEAEAQLEFDWVEEQSTEQNIKNAVQTAVDNLNQITIPDITDMDDLLNQMEAFAKKIKF